MTTHLTPADHGRHLLRTEDPAELLAEARLCLHETPSDCLLLAGAGEEGTSSLLTRSPLHELLGPEGGEHLARHLSLMKERGARAVHALIVLGDGQQDLLPLVIEDLLRRAGSLVLEAARPSRRDGPVLSVQGAAAGTWWSLRRGVGEAPGAEVTLTRGGPLREFAETTAAAAAVLRGHALPAEEAHLEQLRTLGSGLALPAVDIASQADPGVQFTLARTALAPLLSGPELLSAEDTMTKCEQLATLLSSLAVDRLHWELLAQCVEHGSDRRIDRESLLQVLVSDPQWAPHPDVCAGGEWYVGLERMRALAAAATGGEEPGQRRTARSAWRALTAMLVLLGWWNHRFATAGGLVDELREEEPDSTLAPLLSRMTDTPIFPAWWPST